MQAQRDKFRKTADGLQAVRQKRLAVEQDSRAKSDTVASPARLVDASHVQTPTGAADDVPDGGKKEQTELEGALDQILAGTYKPAQRRSAVRVGPYLQQGGGLGSTVIPVR